jgi:hypothetical protein
VFRDSNLLSYYTVPNVEQQYLEDMSCSHRSPAMPTMEESCDVSHVIRTCTKSLDQAPSLLPRFSQIFPDLPNAGIILA